MCHENLVNKELQQFIVEKKAAAVSLNYISIDFFAPQKLVFK